MLNIMDDRWIVPTHYPDLHALLLIMPFLLVGISWLICQHGWVAAAC